MDTFSNNGHDGSDKSNTRGRTRTSSYQSVTGLDLPFLPPSLVEHWMLCSESEELSLVLQEIGDLYKCQSVSDRRFFEHDKMISILKKVLDNLTVEDAAVRLNGIKLLELISEDHTKPLQSVLFVLFSIVQEFFQDSNRVLRSATLKLAVNIVTQLPFAVVSKNVWHLLENSEYGSTEINELCIKIATIAVLNANSSSYIDGTSILGLDGGTLFDTVRNSKSKATSGGSFNIGNVQAAMDQLLKYGLRGLSVANTQSRSTNAVLDAAAGSHVQGFNAKNKVAGKPEGSGRRHTHFGDSPTVSPDSSVKKYTSLSDRTKNESTTNSSKAGGNINTEALIDLVAAALLGLKDYTIDSNLQLINSGGGGHDEGGDESLSDSLSFSRTITTKVNINSSSNSNNVNRDYELLLFDNSDGIHCEVFYKNTLLQLKNEDSGYTISMHIQKDILRRIKSGSFPSLTGDGNIQTKTELVLRKLKDYHQIRLNTAQTNKHPAGKHSMVLSPKSTKHDASLKTAVARSESKRLLLESSLSSSSLNLQGFDSSASAETTGTTTTIKSLKTATESVKPTATRPRHMSADAADIVTTAATTTGASDEMPGSSSLQYNPSWGALPTVAGHIVDSFHSSSGSNASASTAVSSLVSPKTDTEWDAAFHGTGQSALSGLSGLSASSASRTTTAVATADSLMVANESVANRTATAALSGGGGGGGLQRLTVGGSASEQDDLRSSVESHSSDLFPSSIDHSKLSGLKKPSHSQHRRALSAHSSSTSGSSSSNNSSGTQQSNKTQKTSTFGPRHRQVESFDGQFLSQGGGITHNNKISSSTNLKEMATGNTLCRTPPSQYDRQAADRTAGPSTANLYDENPSDEASEFGMVTPLKVVVPGDRDVFSSEFGYALDTPVTGRDTDTSILSPVDQSIKRVTSKHSFHTPQAVGKYDANGDRMQELTVQVSAIPCELQQAPSEDGSNYTRAASSRLRRSRLKSGGSVQSTPDRSRLNQPQQQQPGSNNSSAYEMHNVSGYSLSGFTPSGGVAGFAAEGRSLSHSNHSSAYDMSGLAKSIDAESSGAGNEGGLRVDTFRSHNHNASNYSQFGGHGSIQEEPGASFKAPHSNRNSNSDYEAHSFIPSDLQWNNGVDNVSGMAVNGTGAEQTMTPYEYELLSKSKRNTGIRRSGQAMSGKLATGNTIQHPRVPAVATAPFTSDDSGGWDSSPLTVVPVVPVTKQAGVMRSPRLKPAAAGAALVKASAYNPTQQQNASPPQSRVIARDVPDNDSATVTSNSSAISTNYQDVASSGLTTKSENFEYTAREDILPSSSPQSDFNKALRALETQEWPDIFHTLNAIRKVAIHHSNHITQSGSLHNMVMLVMKQVDNLRSALVKNALITIGDLFISLGKVMDAEMSTVIGGLVKRSCDSSIFISESADSVLSIMVQHASPVRSLLNLLNNAEHKTPAARGKVAQFLYLLVSTRGDELIGSREFESLKQKLSKLLRDQTPEARMYSRHIVKVLLVNRMVGREELELCVSPELVEKSLKDDIPLPVPGATAGASAYNIISASPMRGTRQANGTPSRLRPSALISANSSNHGGGGGHYADQWSPAGSTNSHDSKSSFQFDGAAIASSGGGGNGGGAGAGAGAGAGGGGGGGRGPSRIRNSANNSGAPLGRNIGVAAVGDDRSISAQRGGRGGGVDSAKGTPARPPPRNKDSGAGMSAAAAKRVMESDSELNALSGILASTTVKSWTDRQVALTKLTDLLVRFGAVLKAANKLSVCLDALLVRLEDGSIKVITHALACLERIHAEEPSVLSANVFGLIAPALLGTVANSNRSISRSAASLLQELFAAQPALQTAQYLCQVTLHEKDKLRVSALRYMGENMTTFCTDSETIVAAVKKLIFPTLCKVLFSATTKGDIRIATTEAVKATQNCLRSERVWLWVDEPSQQDEIRRITV